MAVTKWRDTEPESIIWAERPDGTRVRFIELKINDTFRMVWNNRYVDVCHEPTGDDTWYRAVGEPMRADGTEIMQDFGYGVMIEEITADEARKGLS